MVLKFCAVGTELRNLPPDHMQCGARGSFSDESSDKQDLMCAPHKDKKYSGENKIKQMVRGSVEAPQ